MGFYGSNDTTNSVKALKKTNKQTFIRLWQPSTKAGLHKNKTELNHIRTKHQNIS